MLKIVQGCRDSRLDSRVTRDWQAAKASTHVKHAGKLKSYASCCITGQKFQDGQAVNSQLELETQPSREAKSPDHPIWEKLIFHIPSHPTIYRPLYPWNGESFQREFWERNPRDSSNSSTLFLSIIKSLRGTLPKPFLTIPISVRRLFGALGRS